jgi:hypothetical protein
LQRCGESFQSGDLSAIGRILIGYKLKLLMELIKAGRKIRESGHRRSP